MNMQQLMKQAQKMQEQLQKQMETTVVEATAGGGMVSVKMNGNKQLLSDPGRSRSLCRWRQGDAAGPDRRCRQRRHPQS